MFRLWCVCVCVCVCACACACACVRVYLFFHGLVLCVCFKNITCFVCLFSPDSALSAQPAPTDLEPENPNRKACPPGGGRGDENRCIHICIYMCIYIYIYFSLSLSIYIYIYVYIIYIYIYIHTCIHAYTHTYIHTYLTSTLVGADEGPRRERGRGRGESAAGAGPVTTQGKLDRQAARLRRVPWHNHASRQSTTRGRNGQEGHAT